MNIDENTYKRWFSAETDADNQLKSVIEQNNFIEHIPTFEEISKLLFGCENLYDNYNNCPYDDCYYKPSASSKTINSIKKKKKKNFTVILDGDHWPE
jgi:hypothetical protein